MAGDDSVGCVDIISGLPGEIRECILGYLPIRDAVRTSVLSQKWRFSWTRAVQLNICFDEDMIYDMDASPDMYCGWISRVLLSHVGTIHTFVLSVTCLDRLEDMNTWLRFLSRNGIEDLRLLGLIDFFDLPLSIFQCLGRLSCLTLSRMTFLNTPSFSGFPNLVKLVLINLNMSVDVFEKLTSSSLLEVLVIERCDIWSESLDDFDTHKTTTCPPSLNVLRVVCSYYGLDMIHLNTPNLRAASFTMEEVEDIDYLQSNCFDILPSMPKIETLTFDCLLHETSSSDDILTKLPEMLVNLKTVTLHRMDAISVTTLSFMFCIIRSSPNLQTLNIGSFYEEFFSKKCLIAAAAYLDDVVKEELKTSVTTFSVNVCYTGENILGAMLALIECVVSCSPILEKLLIKTSPYMKGPAKLRLSRSLRRLSRSLRRLGRSSSKLKIIQSDATY